MKKVKLKIPTSKAEWLAQFVGENSYTTLLSWSQKEGLFDDTTVIHVWLAFPADAEDKVKANCQEFFTTK